MKVIFIPKDKDILIKQFEEVANHYQAKVVPHDKGEGHFIFVKSRIMITELIRDNEVQIHVSGANDEDLNFLTSVWGDPISVVKEKRSPIDFAKEIAEIPNIDQFDKMDIVTLLDITEADYSQYIRYLERIARRPNAAEEVVKAVQILKDKA